MGIKAIAAKPFANIVSKRIQKWATKPVETQKKVFNNLIQRAQNTIFGKEHDFKNIHSYSDFIKRVKIRDYEALSPYIQLIRNGEKNVLWDGKPIYFAKTSGTTSGTKFIPITKESMPFHVQGARDAILVYLKNSNNFNLVDGKMIFLQGSPILSVVDGIKAGRLSGISAHYVPNYLQKNRMPSWKTNCIEDWEEKVDAIVKETYNENMTLISGIPPWVQMYFEKLQKIEGKNIGDIFPNFNLFIYGGVNYEPYRKKFEELIGRKVDSVELFTASEGFFAYQDLIPTPQNTEPGMLLLLNSQMFYEFVPIDKNDDKNNNRMSVADIQIGQKYSLIVSSNAGLWAYDIGDVVEIVSKNPIRVKVAGRSKQFISAFGEHVIASEVEKAIKTATTKSDAIVNEFTVAPMVNVEKNELPYHQWIIEFEKKPTNIDIFANYINQEMMRQNSYYADLINGNILQPLKIKAVPLGTFSEYLKKKGKYGGQNKINHLYNDRSIADELL